MAQQNVIVIGATGNIGSEFVKQVSEKDAPHLGLILGLIVRHRGEYRYAPDYIPISHANPTNIIGMAHRGGYLYTPGGVSIQNDPALITRLQNTDQRLSAANQPRTALKDWMRRQETYRDGGDLQELLNEIISQGMIDDVVFVDLTANDLTSFHKDVISSGGSIVTANKIPVAQSSLAMFNLLTKFRRRYGYSCSVMAGAGAVPFLRDTFDIRDRVTSVEGCFSGTLGKLCNLLYEGEITFSEAIKQLKVDGDTEPDPRDDLSGMDVAKKIVILARTAGYPIDLADVKIEPFVPGGFRTLSDCSVDEFMAKAGMFDEEIAAKFREAKARGKTLRYVASLTTNEETPTVCLGLREEPLDSPLGSLKGNGNKVVIYTDAYNKVPFELSAPGSGTHITAGNVRRDLLSLLPNHLLTI